jgi:hypothetical protein
MRVLHQAGHNDRWNMQSVADDQAGDGIILSPRDREYDRMVSLDAQVRHDGLFDPQFFHPHTERRHLATYPFFPNVAANGFDSDDFASQDAAKVARRCVKFQMDYDFKYITVPTSRAAGMPSDFVDQQRECFVEPFLSAIQRAGTSKQILLQLVLNEGMIKDESFRDEVLNWVTGYGDIAGVYLIVDSGRTSKQIKDADLLYAMLHFIRRLRENDLEVVVGYNNTEAVLLTIADATALTVGAFETTRVFNIRTFGVKQKSGPPRPRIYSSALLQWVDFGFYARILRTLRGQKDVFDDNRHMATMTARGYRPWVTKPEPYFHYFVAMCKQLRSFDTMPSRQRYKSVSSMLAGASGLFAKLANGGVVLDPDSDGSHLPAWQTAANQFAQDMGW